LVSKGGELLETDCHKREKRWGNIQVRKGDGPLSFSSKGKKKILPSAIVFNKIAGKKEESKNIVSE